MFYAYSNMASCTKFYIRVLLDQIAFLVDTQTSLLVHCNGISEKPEKYQIYFTNFTVSYKINEL